jgi:hypothetical protein
MFVVYWKGFVTCSRIDITNLLPNLLEVIMGYDKDWLSKIKPKVIERDGKCKKCGTTENLTITCVRKFDRGSIDSWICMCEKCRKERYEKNRKTFVRGQDSCKRIMLRRIDEQNEEIRALRDEILRLKR